MHKSSMPPPCCPLLPLLFPEAVDAATGAGAGAGCLLFL